MMASRLLMYLGMQLLLLHIHSMYASTKFQKWVWEEWRQSVSNPAIQARAYRILFGGLPVKYILGQYRVTPPNLDDGIEYKIAWKNMRPGFTEFLIASDMNGPLCLNGQCQIASPGFVVEADIFSNSENGDVITYVSFTLDFNCGYLDIPEDAMNELRMSVKDPTRFTFYIYMLINEGRVECIPKVSVWNYYAKVPKQGWGTRTMDSIVAFTQHLFPRHPEAAVQLIAGNMDDLPTYSVRPDEIRGSFFWTMYGFEFRNIRHQTFPGLDASHSIKTNHFEDLPDELSSTLVGIKYPWDLAYGITTNSDIKEIKRALFLGEMVWYGGILVNQPNSPGMKWRACRASIKSRYEKGEILGKLRQLARDFDQLTIDDCRSL